MHDRHGYFYCMNFSGIDEEPCQLVDCGIELRKEEYYDYDNRIRHEYGGYLLQYTMDGMGQFEDENGCITMKPGMAFLVPMPDASRYYLEPGTGRYWELFYIHMKGPVVITVCEQIRKRTGAVMTLPSGSIAVSSFFEEFEKMRQGKQYRKYEAGEWLYQFLIEWLREVENCNIGESKCVSEAVDWMHHNYATQENLSDMCHIIGVSLSHLTRQFHKEQGITPEQYLMNLRLQQAVNLLVNTGLKVNEVSERCGFSCGNYFSKVFRRKFMMTPTEYRKQYGSRHSRLLR